ncbi:SMC family ATPase [Candidatus Marsarchaeota archaeon]|nr:SMC family ATPase [Candidatus Marsarchaeota archaeon]
MLEYIELTNWKTHGSSTLKFQKGVNVLIGLMGAGKSSVMDAISFALFGTFPALKHKRVKTSDIIRNVPDEHDYAAVTLGFDSEGDRYVVSRRIPKSGTASARLEKNGKPFQTQPTKVTEEIEGILKIDYDTFSRAIY